MPSTVPPRSSSSRPPPAARTTTGQLCPALEKLKRRLAPSTRARKNVANWPISVLRNSSELILPRIADSDGTVSAWVRSEACSIADSSAAGIPLPDTSAIATRCEPSPTGTTS